MEEKRSKIVLIVAIVVIIIAIIAGVVYSNKDKNATNNNTTNSQSQDNNTIANEDPVTKMPNEPDKPENLGQSSNDVRTEQKTEGLTEPTGEVATE